MWIGCHVSIRHGYLQAAKLAHRIGARSFQYFPKNPRRLSIKDVEPHDAQLCKRYSDEHQLLSIAHSPYPTNIATDDPQLRKRVVASILNDLQIAEACGSIGVVVHFGKYSWKDPLQGVQNSLQCLNEVLSLWKGNALILLENQAGEGTQIGTTLEEMVYLRHVVQTPEQIGFCFDTCHAFASGLWNGDNWNALLEKGEQLGYWDHLRAVHLNDSYYPSGSFRDRHANIGQGVIGTDRLISLLQTPAFQQIPVVLETPKSREGHHEQEIRHVIALWEQKE